MSSTIRKVDGFLRRKQGIFEFCDDPSCLLRIALRSVKADFVLSNGFRVQRGKFIGELHFWNEHIPPIAAEGPDFFWAALIRRRAFQSFTLLADYVRLDSRFGDVQILCAKTRLGGNRPSIFFDRLMRTFGFESVEELNCADWWEHLVAFGECLHLWSLLRAYNPTALPNHHFIQLRSRQFWMSRETLLRKYPSISHSSDLNLGENNHLFAQETASHGLKYATT